MATRIPKNGPVSISTVKNALGTSLNSLVALCGHPNINIFATRRPIVHPALKDLTDAQRAERDLGFTLGRYATPELLLAALSDGTAWSADLPDGTFPSQPCRLGDFRGYDHGAPQFVPAEGDIALDGDRNSHDFFAGRVIENTGDLRWTEMRTIKNAWPCVAVINSRTGSLVGWKTAAKTWGDGGGTVTVKAGEDFTPKDGEQYVYALCAASASRTAPFSDPSGAPAAVFWPIPARPALTGKLSWSAIIADVKVTVTGVLGNVSITGNQTLTFRDARLFMGFEQAGATNPYLDVGTSGRLVLLVELTNTGAAVRDTTYIAINTAVNLVGAASKEIPGIFPVTAGSGYGSVTIGAKINPAVNPVAIPAGGSVRLALALPALLTTKGLGTAAQTVPAGTKALAQLGFEWNDVASSNVHMAPSLLRVTS